MSVTSIIWENHSSQWIEMKVGQIHRKGKTDSEEKWDRPTDKAFCIADPLALAKEKR